MSATVPPWLDTLAAVGWRVLATIAMLLVLAAMALAVPSATAATLVALVLAAAIAPTVRGLRARGLSPTISAAIACLVGGAVIVAAALLLVLGFVPDVLAVASAVTNGLAGLREQLVTLGIPDLALRTYDRVVESLLAMFSLDPAAYIGSAVTFGTVAVLGTFLTFFLLQDGDRGWAWLMRSQDPWRVATVTASARAGLDRVSWYLRRTAVLAAVDALVVAAVLFASGVPLVGALAAVAFVAGFVPYLGAVFGSVIVALSALALEGPSAAAAVVASLVAVWVASTRALERTPMHRRVDAHPVLVLIALPAGAALFGLLGLIAVLPVTVFALAISRSLVVALDLGPGGSPTPRRPDGLPVWLDRLAQWSWRGLVLAGLGFVALQAVTLVPAVVVPLLISVVGAATLRPLVSRLVRAGWPRGVAAAVATLGTAIAVVAAIGIALGMTVGPLSEIIAVAIGGAQNLDLTWLVEILEDIGSVIVIDAGAALGSVLGLALSLALSLLLTFFLLRDGPAWWHAAAARIHSGRRAPIAEAGRRTVDGLAGYMIGTAIISAFGGFTSGLIMVILGLPLGLPIAVLTFFASFIPYIGGAITTALAFLIAVAVGSTADIVIMGVFTIVFNIVQGNFVTPLVYGKSLNLHPAVVLMAIPVGGELAGILGMFMVVPIAAVISATWRLALRAVSPDRPAPGGSAAVPAPLEPGTA